MGEVATEVSLFDFYGDRLMAVEIAGTVYVAVKPIAGYLGIDWSSQRKRLLRDVIFSEGMVMTTTPSGGGMQEAACLRLDLLHGWLLTIDDRRVKPELRERVLTYKRHCYALLHEHFTGKAQARAARLAPTALHELLLLPRPMPPLLTRSRANRIRHWRAIHDQAVATLMHLGDEFDGVFTGEMIDRSDTEDVDDEGF